MNNIELPKPVQGTAKFIEKRILADTVYEFKFQMVSPNELDFKAGQYIALEIDKQTRRQYSISTSPLESKDTFQIVIDIKPDGVGTKYLMGHEPGDEIKFIGQIGNFYMPNGIDLAPNLFFIATGAGIAPLKSMMETLILSEQDKNHNIYLYFGTRYVNDVFYDDVFDKYLEDGSLQEYRIFLSNASMPGALEGHVTQFINFHDQAELDNAQFFLCGSGKMINSVEEELVKNEVPESAIIYEKFY